MNFESIYAVISGESQDNRKNVLLMHTLPALNESFTVQDMFRLMNNYSYDDGKLLCFTQLINSPRSPRIINVQPLLLLFSSDDGRSDIIESLGGRLRPISLEDIIEAYSHESNALNIIKTIPTHIDIGDEKVASEQLAKLSPIEYDFLKNLLSINTGVRPLGSS